MFPPVRNFASIYFGYTSGSSICFPFRISASFTIHTVAVVVAMRFSFFSFSAVSNCRSLNRFECRGGNTTGNTHIHEKKKTVSNSIHFSSFANSLLLVSPVECCVLRSFSLLLRRIPSMSTAARTETGNSLFELVARQLTLVHN